MKREELSIVWPTTCSSCWSGRGSAVMMCRSPCGSHTWSCTRKNCWTCWSRTPSLKSFTSERMKGETQVFISYDHCHQKVSVHRPDLPVCLIVTDVVVFSVFSVVVGAKEVVITSAEELLSVLEMGNALRHTAAMGMNEHSSRSHAILTLQVIQGCRSNSSSQRSIRSSKLSLVDLAGSERAGKTGNTGTRLKESSQINTGLLALGNVIRALSDQRRSRRGISGSSAHIPYRDAKITRLLRDSLGGTAHTLMVACVSPSHHFVAETLSVLQFASKARHIRNRPASMCTQAVSCPTNWHTGEARLRELEYELQTLRELLKEKKREMEVEREKTGGDDSSQSRASEPDTRMKQEEAPQCRALLQEASALLAEASGPSPSVSFKQQVQNWQERLTAVNHSHQIYDKVYTEQSGDQMEHVAVLKLREELKKCQVKIKDVISNGYFTVSAFLCSDLNSAYLLHH